MTEINSAELADHNQWTASASVRPTNFYRDIGKRVLDVAIVLISLPIIVPVILFLTVLVSLDGKAPFYGHSRLGRNGRSFKCWKLRSMAPNADEKLKIYLKNNPQAKAEWEDNYKLDNDPRVTWIGTFLRKSSLDELPQIFNILKGDMSIVGPRPITHQETYKYKTGIRHYYSIRPGLTGLWQVTGRNSTSYNTRVLLDVAYSKNYNIGLDLFIIIATFRSLILRTGK